LKRGTIMKRAPPLNPEFLAAAPEAKGIRNSLMVTHQKGEPQSRAVRASLSERFSAEEISCSFDESA